MKKNSVAGLIGIFFILTGIPAVSQEIMQTNTSAIAPYHLAITYFMTTNLIFPYSIQSVDRGSLEVLAQKAKGVENILQIKAGRENFEKTNLTVVTCDGRLYSFLLTYTSSPSVLNLKIGKKAGQAPGVIFPTGKYNEAEVKNKAQEAMLEKEKFYGVKDAKYNMAFRLDGLFIHNGIMYFRINIANHSDVNYDIDQLRFFVRDQQKIKRTASQEIEIKPVYVQNDTSVIPGQAEHYFVYALPKFTIPDKKYLIIQLMEKNGGRHLALKMGNRKIIKAVYIN